MKMGTLAWDYCLLGDEDCHRTLRGHQGYVRACAFSPDRRAVASASLDGTLASAGSDRMAR
jgi:WD40 repeat protein